MAGFFSLAASGSDWTSYTVCAFGATVAGTGAGAGCSAVTRDDESSIGFSLDCPSEPFVAALSEAFIDGRSCPAGRLLALELDVGSTESEEALSSLPSFKASVFVSCSSRVADEEVDV